MDNNNKKSTYDIDKTGEIISWVIVFIFMFAFWPIGLFLLFRKLSGYAKPKRQSRITQQSGGIQKSGVQELKQAVKKSRKRNPLMKKTGRFISFVLLLISIIMVILGVTGLSEFAQQFFGNSSIDWYNLGMSTFAFSGGLGAFFSRNVVAHRYARYKNYYAFADGRGVIPMSELSQMAGVPVKTVIRDIQTMINNGYLDYGAYIDNELECLVLSSEEAEKLRRDIRSSHDASPQPEDMSESQYMAVLAELREVNDFIADETISKKVERLEELTAKIFRIVEESPEKQPQIRRFMSYYLPTTLKLARSYATLEKQGVKGENIMTAKKSIGNILDTLATGYEQQLDQLFKSDAIDIAADINVLENLMQQDGLTGDKSEFQVMESGT